MPTWPRNIQTGFPMREKPTPSLCPCCAGPLMVVREIYEVIGRDKTTRRVHVCFACEIKVVIHRMPRKYEKARS